jgi:hypothetical protein
MNDKELEVLKHEYYRCQVKRHEEERPRSLFWAGKAAGLETALIFLDVSNDEIDQLCREAYKEAQRG